MILSGDLKDFSLADVLQLLMQQHKTGTLTLTAQREKAELFITQGNLTGVRLNGASPETKVKDMLIETGKVGKREIDDLEDLSRDMARPVLDTLVAKGHLTEADRKEWLQIITEDMVCELFGWVEGKYEFGSLQKGAGAQTGELNISTEFACMEGMRRIDEWPRLREAIPDFNAIYRPLDRESGGDPGSWDNLVLGLVDGRRTLAQIGKQVPFGTFRLSECIVNLCDGGFIAPLAAEDLDPGVQVQADPQSEKDRKTAMVLGIAVLLLVFGTTVRLLSFWMMGAIEHPGGGARNAWDYESGIAHAMAKDNMEAFLIDHAAREDSLPKSPRILEWEGVLTSREIAGSGGGKILYQKTTEKAFILK